MTYNFMPLAMCSCNASVSPLPLSLSLFDLQPSAVVISIYILPLPMSFPLHDLHPLPPATWSYKASALPMPLVYTYHDLHPLPPVSCSETTSVLPLPISLPLYALHSLPLPLAIFSGPVSWLLQPLSPTLSGMIIFTCVCVSMVTGNKAGSAQHMGG